MKLKFTRQRVMEYPSWGFRAGTVCVPRPINFLFINGGMGDYICWMQAILWLAKNATWVQGRLICPDYFMPLARYWLQDTDWKVWNYDAIQDPEQQAIPVRGPVNLKHESLNATGAHLLDCGFAYYACQNPPPEGWNFYPRLTGLPAFEISAKPYCVVTTGKTTPSRHVPDSYWNHVIEHCVSRGFTPVFLGASTMHVGSAESRKDITGREASLDVKTSFGKGVRYDLGIDLRDKTSLLEAAAIIDKAAFVVGHDNGLLHLAGCTDTPIVFGYNVAAPIHRRPRRANGRIYDVTLSHADLACNHCQSKTNFVIGFVFHTCFYGDNKCIDLLFADSAARWKQAIDQCIGDLR